MLTVTLQEQPRVFHLFVGQMKVGRVRAWHENHAEAWVNDKSMTNGERFVRSEPTLRRAMQAVLEAAGYGKASGHKVKWRKCR